MISLESAISVVIYLCVAAAVFGLLYLLIQQFAKLFSAEASALFLKIAQIVLFILAILVCISALMHLAGHPLWRW